MKYFTISILISIVLWLIGQAVPPFSEIADCNFWYITLTLWTALSVVLSKWVAKAALQSPLRFTTAIYGVTLTKMMLTPSIIAVYLVLNHPNPTAYALGVFAVFLAHTIHLVIDSQSTVRRG